MNPGERVYAQVSPTHYLRKNIADVNVGDMILYQKPYARTDLEHVAPFLERSPRYARAKELLHEQNSRGSYVPRFRKMLLRGLAQQGVIADQEIDARALYEADDFSGAEYRTMENWLVNLLNEHGIRRSETGVGNWLRGETLAPSNWRIFNVLAQEINPEFREFEQYSDDPKGMYFNYRLYVVIRQGIMRYLNDCRGTHEEPSESEPTPAKISLSPEYAIVFQHFMNDKDMTHATARVTGIETVKKKNLEQVRRNNPVLGDGVVKIEMERLTESLRDYQDILNFMEVLDGYIEAFIEDFEYDNEFSLFDRHTKSIASPYTIPYLIESFGEDLDEVMILVKKQSDLYRQETNDGLLEGFIDATKRAFLERDMDSFFGYDNGTALRLLESYHRIRKLIPNRVHRFCRNCTDFTLSFVDNPQARENPLEEARVIPAGREVGLLNVRMTPKIKKQIDELKRQAKELRERCGIRLNIAGKDYGGGVLLSNLLLGVVTDRRDMFSLRPLERPVSSREYIELYRHDKEAIRIMQEQLGEGQHLIDRAHISTVLNEFGLGHIRERRWQDFLWEDI